MALALEDKQQIVADVAGVAQNALSLVVADSRGVNLSDMTRLRKIARENLIDVRVIRNTLAKRAFSDTPLECVAESLVGPSLFGFSMEDPGSAARVFKDFAKENEFFQIKVLSVGGKLLSADQIDVLAKLPTHDQALSMLMSVMLAPITKLARTFNEVPAKVTRVIAAVRDQKQST